MGDALVAWDSARYEALSDVVNLYLKGNNPTTIAKLLGRPRAEVVLLVEEWREIAQNDEGVKQRAREALTAMTLHYDLLVNEFWAIADQTADEKNKLTALKHIADVEKIRQDTLQKAGMYDDAVLGDEVAKAEEQIAEIRKMLIELVKTYPATKAYIMKELSRIFQTAVGVDDTYQPDIVIKAEDISE